MFRKLMPVAKKPWAKDVTNSTKQEGDIHVTSDNFKAEQIDETDEDYEYYDDGFFRKSDNKMMSTNRFSSIADMKQASLYFDYKLSNRDLVGTSKNPGIPRMSNGIVPTPLSSSLPQPPKTKPPAATRLQESRDAVRPGGRFPRSGSAPRGRTVSILSETFTGTIAEEDEEDSDEDDGVTMVRVRSLSPVKMKPAEAPEPNCRRAQLVKRNSWSSSRQMLKVEDEHDGKKKSEGGRRKNGTGNRDRKPRKDASNKSSDSNNRRKKKSDGHKSTSSRSETKSSDLSKSERSRSKSGRSRSPKATRKKLQRSNSWSSSRGLDTSDVDKDDLLRVESPSSGKQSSKNREHDHSARAKSNPTPEEELDSIVASPKSRQALRGFIKPLKTPSLSAIVGQIKKTQGFVASVANLSSKKDLDNAEISQVQAQLAEALAKIEQLTAEQEKAMDGTSTASTEVDELKAMLAESAKENNELHDRLALIQSELGDGQSEVERYKQNFEMVLEEKHALADEMNRTEVELRTLRSRIRNMETRASIQLLTRGVNKKVSLVTGLQNTNFEMETLAIEQSNQIEEQLRKIEELEQRILEGGGEDAQKVIRLTEEVELLKKEQKKTRMEMSVQLAKKDAMIASLQCSAAEEKEKMEKLVASKAEVEEELKNVKAQLTVAEEEVGKTMALHDRIKELEGRVQDAETVEKGLQDAIDKWTDKAFEWKEKAEGLEDELMKLKGSEADAGVAAKQAWRNVF